MRKPEPEIADRLRVADQLEKQSQKNQSLIRYPFFIAYGFGILKTAPLYVHWKNFLSYIRRFRMIALTVRILSFLLTALETGALVILSTVIFLIIFPIACTLMLGILLTAFLESRRTNRMLLGATREKTIYVLFLQEHCSPFFLGNARDLVGRGGVVIVVSPFWLSTRGLTKRGFYCTARAEESGIFLIRRYYFFSLKKHVLNRKNVVFFY